MKPEDLTNFKKAVSLAGQGDKRSAYERLKSLQVNNPLDSNLLLWLTFTAPNLVEIKQNFDRLKLIDPSNPNLPSAWEWVQAQLKSR